MQPPHAIHAERRSLLLHTLLTALPMLLFFVYTAYSPVFSDPGADTAALLKAARARHPVWSALMHALTDWGNFIFYIVYARLLLQGWRQKDEARLRLAGLYVAVQLIVAFGVVRLLKIMLGRPRPGVEGLYDFFSFAAANNSLPSGHTTEIFGAALPLALWKRNPALSLGLGAFAGIVGASRVFVGSHHVSDTVFGLLLGLFAGLLTYTLWKRKYS